MKLHLGCGKLYLKNWVNIDLNESCVDMKHDVKNFKDVFENDTIDEIYISHTLEHFSRTELIDVLCEYNRILKFGGILRIAVPDLDSIFQLYNENKSNIFDLMGLIYGGQKNNLDFHMFGFTFETLYEILICIGFDEICKYDAFEFLGDLDDYSKAYIPHMDKTGKLMSLNITCKKISNQFKFNDKVKKLLKL